MQVRSPAERDAGRAAAGAVLERLEQEAELVPAPPLGRDAEQGRRRGSATSGPGGYGRCRRRSVACRCRRIVVTRTPGARSGASSKWSSHSAFGEVKRVGGPPSSRPPLGPARTSGRRRPSRNAPGAFFSVDQARNPLLAISMAGGRRAAPCASPPPSPAAAKKIASPGLGADPLRRPSSGQGAPFDRFPSPRGPRAPSPVSESSTT